MKFFRQKSSDQRRLSLTVYGFTNKTVDSVDEIVRKLRQALNKTQTNNTFHTIEEQKKLSITKSEANVYSTTNTSNSNASNGSNSEMSNESHIKQYLENLRQNIIFNKLFSDNYMSEVNEQQNSNENQNNNIIQNNLKIFSSFTEELFSSDIILELIEKLPLIGFENKKLVANIVCNALLLKIEDRLVTVDYICKEPEILFCLIDTYKYGRSDLTLNCGRILRQCLKHECLARIALNSQQFLELFSYVNQKTFDVAMDAFITFQSLLTTHKELSEEYLIENNELFFDNYMKLINSNNYVTKRQSLEILALILSYSQTNRDLFCKQTQRLTVILDLFWHHYRHIRFRALNVFNVLICADIDGHHSMEIIQFLINQNNRQRLVEVLKNFRDFKTKCKFFSDLKPFATKLIHFFEETTDITQ